jgi:hypothetical protein
MAALIFKAENEKQSIKLGLKSWIYQNLPQNENYLLDQAVNAVEVVVPNLLEKHGVDHNLEYPSGSNNFSQEGFLEERTPSHIETEFENRDIEQDPVEDDEEFYPNANLNPGNPMEPNDPVSLPTVEPLTLEKSLEYIFLRNELPSNAHEWTQRYVQVQQVQELNDKSKHNDIIIVRSKRSNEFTIKSHIVISNMVAPGRRFENCAIKFGIDIETAQIVFSGGDTTPEILELIINNNALFYGLFDEDFLENVLVKMIEESKRDINTNFLEKLNGLTPDGQLEFLENQIDRNKNGTKFKRSFKKPFMLQENIAAIINYLKSAIFKIKKDKGMESTANLKASERLVGDALKEKFDILLQLKAMFEEKLFECGLIKDETKIEYPTTKLRKTKGWKDLDVQTFLKKRPPASPDAEVNPFLTSVSPDAEVNPFLAPIVAGSYTN